MILKAKTLDIVHKYFIHARAHTEFREQAVMLYAITKTGLVLRVLEPI